MRAVFQSLLLGSILISGLAAQDPNTPRLRPGVSVKMAVASHPVEMRAADELNATVVAITADGTVYLGVKRTDPIALSQLSKETVYVKADSRASYQAVLGVVDALRGKSVVLLTAAPKNAARDGMVSPYGVKLIVPR
jgi:hypothetical protein